MVSPLPDLVVAELTSDDEFLVMACDGIWNSMTSQEVVDFVRVRLSQGEALEATITQVGWWCDVDTCES
jgi:serine/threonine protein phosphatase PrpC